MPAHTYHTRHNTRNDTSQNSTTPSGSGTLHAGQSLSSFALRPMVRAMSLAVCGLALCAGNVVAAQAPAASTPRAETVRQNYHIAAGALAPALRSVASAANLLLTFTADQTEGKTTAGLNGPYSAEDALHALLAGTGLQAVRLDNDGYVLREAPAPVNARQTEAVLPTVIVSGKETDSNTIGYVALQSSSATKTSTSLLRVPASISVVTQQQLVDQNAQSTSQALRYTPGIVAEQRGVNEDSLEYLYTRGFQARTFLDGLAIPFAGFNIATRDTYLVDRVESVRGPVSVLYGQTPPGGLVNIVTKQPTSTPLHEVFAETGSYGRIRTGIDLGGPIKSDGTLNYRFTAVGLNTGTQTDYVRQKRVALAGAVTWKATDKDTLTVSANYQKDPEAGAFNYVPAVGTVLPGKVLIPRSLNTGDPSYDKFSKEETSVGYHFEHLFSPSLQFRQNVRYLSNSQTIHHVGDGSDYDPTGTQLERLAYNNYGSVNALTADNQLVSKFRTGAVQHEVVTGIDFQHTNYNHHLYYGRFDNVDPPNLDINHPVYGQPVAAPDFMLGSSTQQLTKQTGVYAQDQATVGRFTVVTGLRQDWASTRSVSYRNGSISSQANSAVTGRIGVSYKLTDELAPYASYSTSFQPQSGTTNTGALLKPSEGKQYEAGIKYQPTGGLSFATASVFNLTQTNLTVANSLYPGSVTQTGEVRSQGVELEAHAYVTDRFQVIASNTYDSVKNTHATANILDKAPAGIPTNMSALWMSYELPRNIVPGLKIGGGARYIGESNGNPTNTFKVPSYTLFDAGIQYDVSRVDPSLKGFMLNLNASNLFNKVYTTCTDLTYCTYGQGRLILAGVKYQW